MRAAREGRVQFMEICCYPDSSLSAAFAERKGNYLRVTLQSGYGLFKEDTILRIKKLIDYHEPMLVWVSPDCGPWQATH